MRFAFLLLTLTALISTAALASTSSGVRCESLFNGKPSTLIEIVKALPAEPKLDFNRINNEKKQFYFRTTAPLHGTLLGLGGDINYNLAVFAKHQSIVIYDMDPQVIGFHYLVNFAMKRSSSTQQFIEFFKKIRDIKDQTPTYEQLIQQIANQVHDIKLARQLVQLAVNSKLDEHFIEMQNLRDDRGQQYSYLASEENFQYLRQLFLNDKVHLFLGSHFSPDLAQAVISQVKADGYPVTSIYSSNSLEPRWTSDPKDPEIAMAKMISSLGSNYDRADMSEIFKKTNAKITEIKNALSQNQPLSENVKKEFIQQLTEIQQSMMAVQFKMAYYQASIKNWYQLTAFYQALPISEHSQFLSTSLEPFQTSQLQNYSVFGTEVVNPSDSQPTVWSYAAASLRDFITQMNQAPENQVTRLQDHLRSSMMQIGELMQQF